jgi:hypothetical protein
MTRRQENLTLIGLLVLLLVASGTFYLSQRTAPAAETVSVRLEEPETVTRIVLTTGVDTVDLSFSGSWKVNGTQEADRELIQILFATLQQLRAKRPVTGSQADSIRTMLGTAGTRIRVFSGDEPELDITVGGDKMKTQAYVMMEDVAPYVVVIPGYRVYAAGIFELQSVEWRDKRVFNFNWRNFAGLRVSPRDAGEGITIKAGDRGILVDGSARADTAVLNTLLDNISLLRVERFLKPREYASRLPILSKGAEVLFEVTDIAGNVYRLEVFESGGAMHLARIDGQHLAEIGDEEVRGISFRRGALIRE